MNGENNHVFHTSALDGVAPDRDEGAWGWIAIAHLWLLAVFVGMSLVAIAAVSLFDGGDAASVMTPGMAGALLASFSWRSLMRVVDRAERDAGQLARTSVSAKPAAAHARMTGITPAL
jgi:hypothetical protein